MTSKKTLDMMVSAAVGAMLVGREAITLEEAEREMPEHIRAARPTHKSIVRAILAAGWEARRSQGGHVSYQPASDPAEDSDRDGEGERGLGDNVSAEQLRLLIERKERLIDEKKGIADDIKDLDAEIKSSGFDLKSVNHVIKLRGQEKHLRDESDAFIEMYRNAVGLT